MKAMVYTESGSPDVLKLANIAQPVPEENEILVKIYAAAVTDIDKGFRRPMGGNNTGEARQKMLGHYFAGTVDEVGKNTTRFKKGDAVYGGDVWNTGTFAEYKCIHENGVLAVKPAGMTFEEAAVLTYGGLTALPFLRGVGKIKKGQKVLVIGAAGSIGTYAVQLAQFYGAEVTGVCSTAKIDMVKALGATQVIDYTRDDFTKSGQTYDIIFDTPAKYSFSRCKDLLTKNGRYLTTVPWPATLVQMLLTSITGGKKAIFAPMGLRSTRKKTRDLVFLNELYKVGKIKPVIGQVFPLEKTADAYRYIEKGHKKGNIAIKIDHTN
jgi:NADPH:quinone reductase-like Zn-dependent oxidoreductase